MAVKKTFKWVVEYTVNRVWVEDGFDLTPERAKDWIENDLSSSYSGETKARILSKPTKTEIKEAQGYIVKKKSSLPAKKVIKKKATKKK